MVLMGLAMGATAVAIIHSPMGQRSGAHFNPAVTLTFYRLGKLHRRDAAGYVAAQFAGGVLGVIVAALTLRGVIAHPSVNYAVTVPGPQGAAVAFAAEVLISFLLMSVILRVSNHARLARFTPFFSAALVATYITFVAPLSGMSMNPARTFASALPAGVWTAIWIYFTAPLIGMLVAAELYARTRGAGRVYCAKLHHDNSRRCIFFCRWHELVGR
jgi:aquaporin Z